MVGVVADNQRLNKSQEEFGEVYAQISAISPAALKELKSTKIFYGNEEWRGVDPDVRKGIFEYFCDWICNRKHALALTAIDTEKHAAALGHDVPEALNDIWISGALHVALQVQKVHQKESKNKGHTFLIFDENPQKTDRLTELLYSPPQWTDSYYERKKNSAPLSQVIDTAFFVKSHHAGLIQVADLFAFVFRRFSEIADYGMPEGFDGEQKLINGYVERLSTRLFRKSFRWPTKSKSASANWFTALAPPSLVALR